MNLPVLPALGINLASAGAYDYMRAVLTRKFGLSSYFYRELVQRVSNVTGCVCDPMKCRMVVDDPEAWFSLMVSPRDGDWLGILFEILPLNADEEVAEKV